MQGRDDALIPIVEENLPETPSTKFMAAEVMRKRGCDPISRLIDLAEELEEADREYGKPMNSKERRQVYTTLAKYYTPQPKSIDINIARDETHTIQVVDFTSLYEKREEFIPEQSRYEGPQLLGVTEDEEFEQYD